MKNQIANARLTAAAFLVVSMQGCFLTQKRSAGSADPAPGEKAPAAAVTSTLSASTAAISSAAAIQASGYVHLVSTGDGPIEKCANTGTTQLEAGPLDVYNASDPAIESWFFSFLPERTIQLTAVQYFLKKTGTPTGFVDINIYGPALGSPIASVAFDPAALTTSYVLTTIAFSPAVTLSAGTQYYFTLEGGNAISAPYASGGGGVWYQSMIAGNCGNSAFQELEKDTHSSRVDSGMVPDIRLLAPAYPTSSPTATFTADAGTAGAAWYPSSLTANENPGGQGGSLTYDIGTSDSATPTYAHLGLTKAQVIALNSLDGRYLFIRANLESTGFDDAAIGDLTMKNIP